MDCHVHVLRNPLHQPIIGQAWVVFLVGDNLLLLGDGELSALLALATLTFFSLPVILS